MSSIHPTACISSSAILGKNVTVGAFAVIEDKVEIADDCHIMAHSFIHSDVKLGKANVVHPQVVLGGLPQDLGFDASIVSYLQTGENCVFREGFTAHRATVENGATLIGSNCYFMNNSHVAHDCVIGDETIFANNVAIGGFVEVGNNVFVGGATVIHQFCRVGAFAMVQGALGVNMDVMPFMLLGGQPIRHYRLNTLGLKRAGIKGERYKVLVEALRLLRKKQGLDTLSTTPELALLRDWLAVKSKRGVHGLI